MIWIYSYGPTFQTWATYVLIYEKYDFLTKAPFVCLHFEYRLILNSLLYLHLQRFVVNNCSALNLVASCYTKYANSVTNEDTCDTYLSETKFVAETTTSSVFCTMTGILRQPGDFRILAKSFMVSWSTLGGHMSIFVTTTNTGTLSANASPRCSEGQTRSTKFSSRTDTCWIAMLMYCYIKYSYPWQKVFLVMNPLWKFWFSFILCFKNLDIWNPP